MKLIGLIVFGLCSALATLAQQDPLFAQSYVHPLYFNPAVAGSKDVCQASLFFRKQWVNLEGAPQAELLSFDSPFNYQRMGAGLNIVHESIVAEEKLLVNGTYAYKINLGKGKLSFGASLGFAQYRFDPGKARIKDLDDQLLEPSGRSSLSADLGVGFLYSKKDFVLGISSTHLNQPYNGYLNSTNSKSRTLRHFYLLFEKKIILSPNVYVSGFFTGMYLTNKHYHINGGGVATIKESLRAGIMYRNNHIMVAHIGITLDKINTALQNLWLNYAYEFNTRSSGNIGYISHEIMLSYAFEWPKKVESIRNKPNPISPIDF